MKLQSLEERIADTTMLYAIIADSDNYCLNHINRMTLKEYCKQQNISMKELAELTEVQFARLYKIDQGCNITVETMNKIYLGTHKKFGTGLSPTMYTKLYI